MATGDQADFVRRLRGLLPAGWFPTTPASGETEQAPVLVGMLSGFGAILSGVWTWFAQVATFSRLSSSTGEAVDLWAADYFGTLGLARQDGETDDAYKARILLAFSFVRNTRAAVQSAADNASGVSVTLIEPMRAMDTHAMASLASPASGGGYGYGYPGLRYGSLVGGQFYAEAKVPRALFPAVFAALETTKSAGVIAYARLIDTAIMDTDFGGDIA